MSEPWKSTTIRQCLVESFAGEWGSNPRPGNAKVLRATDIDDDGHVVGPGAIRQLPIGKLTAKRLLDGDILLEGSGGGPGKPVGRVAYFEANDHYEAAVCSNFFKTLRPKRSEVEPRFLLRKLAWFYKQAALLTLQQQTTGIINLKFEEYLSAQIEIPETIGEQQKLAQVLDTLDTAIHETEAIIAKLKAVKQGLLHDLLTRGIDANGELRPPQAEAPHLYKDSPLGWIPEEWDLSTVGEQFEIQLGKMLDGQKNAGVLKPYLGNKAVQWDRVDLGEVQQVRLSKSDLIRFRLRKGDLLVCEGGDVGRAAIWDNDLEECYYQKALHRLRPLRGYHPRLMLETLRYLMGRDALSEYISRTSIAHLTQAKLAAVPLTTPKVDEQERMVVEILTAKQRLETEESQLQKLMLLKSGLMDDLLTGRVRVTPLLEGVTP